MSGNTPPEASRKLGPSEYGFYSNALNPEYKKNVEKGPDLLQNLQWASATQGITPKLENVSELPGSRKYGGDTRNKVGRKFTEESSQPKVQTPFYVPPGFPPRKLVIERKRREYEATRGQITNEKLTQLLENRDVDLSKIIPDPEDMSKFCLPLDVFDNCDWDCRTPAEWAQISPLPCRVFAETISSVDSQNSLTGNANNNNNNGSGTATDLHGVASSQTTTTFGWHFATAIGLVSEDCFGDGSGGIWKIENEKEKIIQETSRILILFEAEDPVTFCDRLSEAYRQRKITENQLQQQLYIDSMPRGRAPQLPPQIYKVLTDTISKDGDLCYKDKITNEIIIDYQRCENKQVFEAEARENPALFAALEWSFEESKPIKRKTFPIIPKYDYEGVRTKFLFASLLTRAEVIDALGRVRQECNKVRYGMSLFNTITTKPLRLEEFEQSQLAACTQTSLYLKEPWINATKGGVRSALQYMGKGWFNLEENNYATYVESKMRKMLNVIRFAMQDSLRYLVEGSCTSYFQMINETCKMCLDLAADDFEWGPNLKKSNLVPLRAPIILIELTLGESAACFSTDLTKLREAIINVFDAGINATQAVPQIERGVMPKIFWKGNVLLESVGKMEPHISGLRDALRENINAAIVPLQAYAREYNQFLEFYHLSIEQYLSEINLDEMTAKAIKNAVDEQYSLAKQVLNEVPSNITIGPFLVQVELVRQNLSRKHKKLGEAILDLLARKLRHQGDDACNLCKSISHRLNDKPACIEDLTEMREWMESVPLELERITIEVEQAVADYDLVEEFYYPLSQDDFNVRWEAVFWPGKLQKHLESTGDVLNDIENNLQKIQLKDQNEFQERLESMKMVVAGFAAYSDPTKAHEVANEVRRTVKAMNECQESANLYNQRERLFDMNPTDYSQIQKLQRDFQPYKDLWTNASDWVRGYDTWMNDSLQSIDPEALDRQVADCFRVFHKATRAFKDIPNVLQVADGFKAKVNDFKPYVPLIQGLRNPGMRLRHWEKLSENIGMTVRPKKELTFQKCLDMKLPDYTEQINKVSEVAAKEYAIEQALDKMEAEWGPVLFEVLEYKDTGTFIIKSPDEASQLLDDHIVMTQSMSFSPFKKPFEERIIAWEQTLRITQDVLDEWLNCQRSWLYLEPIFASEDINRQLPVESKRYQTMDRAWRKIMKAANDNPKVIEICANQALCDKLKECNALLEQVQKGLSEYLETKRMGFPRFFFLSDDELLEILSQTKDPTAVQPHLRKCFENIAKITFGSDLAMSEMISGEGEKVDFSEVLYPKGNVENWLSEVERVMGESIRRFLKVSIDCYRDLDRCDWVLKWPGQVVIAGCQVYWAEETEEAIAKNDLVNYCERLTGMLSDLVRLVRGKLTNLERMILSALIVIEVHAKDVVYNLKDEEIKTANDFEWISQLRYYWDGKGLFIRAVNAEFPYGYEYLGNTGRLVITPLTDRCYLTLTGALHLKFGGAPAGPAGTGKTETTKDLGKALAIQTVVFNCSDQLDYMAMGKFFKGLASSGAWACFDEFNRIDIEVLSVVAQQITTIQKAQFARADTFVFEGAEIRLIQSCAVFITMNPGYAGRTELPDNLKALFRPVAMMVPDYAMIAEISLYSFGFEASKVLAKKITSTFTLSSEQLSSQDHYDFGMRAVKTVISAAGILKREHPDMEEELICLRAIRDVNVPKFLIDDLKLFRGIVSDLFPGIQEEEVDYGSLLGAIQMASRELNIEPVEGFVNKCIQLYETTVVRHGLMLVGPTMSGKTKCSKVLAGALTHLQGQDSISGGTYERVHISCLNPKSISMGQLYGEFDLMTHEWTDGILSSLIRIGCTADNEDKRWYLFDGPVDAVWIENMNTVLDDNKKLCLSSGEIIKLSNHMTMMFEVADLAVASPATVSRCGMVYLEPSYIGLSPFVDCWIQLLPGGIDRQLLKKLFDTYLEPCIDFVRRNCREIVPSVNGNLVFSLLNLMDCFMVCLKSKDVMPVRQSRVKLAASTSGLGIQLTDAQKQRRDLLLEPWFMFSLTWSIGATTDDEGRHKFSDFVRGLMTSAAASLPFPDDGQIFDYVLDEADLGGEKTSGMEINEEEEMDWHPEWVHWLTKTDEYSISEGTSFTDILVPTIDTVRAASILAMLVENSKHVLAVGTTGTGKSVVIADKLLTGMADKFVPNIVTFSAKTSANQTQDLIDGRLDKRRKGVFGPPISKYAIFFIDDFNMPALEEYGAQPPIELIRQWMDHTGWYDRKAIGAFRTLVDIGFVCAMGPPGGGRNPVTARLLRHYNYLSFVEMSDESKGRIFGTILESWLPSTLMDVKDIIVDSTISVYSIVSDTLLPTPSKSHYTFNLRDMAKVFQGMLMFNAGNLNDDKNILCRLWHHEASRIFKDRLINEQDRNWFDAQLENQVKTKFELDFEIVVPTGQPIIFADFCNDAHSYRYVDDHEKLVRIMEENLEDYNQISTAQMKLVLFMDAAQHVSRISRIIRQPLGNGLMLGMGGSGRQSLTRLAAHLADYECFQIELAKNYGVSEWRDDIKKIMMKAGLQNNPIVFLFSDTQIKQESFLEDVNNILNSGDVPNMYATDDLDSIYSAMKPEVANAGLPPTKSNMFSCYTKRVKANLHTVVCMSPIGEIFRARLRQFPSLITCCTIDWFTEWPSEALRSVATTFVADAPVPEDILGRIVEACMEMHLSVSRASGKFLQELQRHNYVTPTSYLDLLAIFDKLIVLKIHELKNNRDRMKIGLDKLLKTAEDVAQMQIDLEAMKPKLEKAKIEASVMLEQIKKDTVVAEETQAVVSKQEADATVVAEKANRIAEDAQRDLDEALPALEEAVKSLKSLNTNDVVEVRSMQRPPSGVRLVLEAVCIMFLVKPKRVPGEKPGQKIDDYWEPGKGLLKEPPKFLDSLFKFDKDNIPDKVIKQIQPYMESEEFLPAAIAKSSKACTSICMWVRAMHKYHFVAKGVEPKRLALAEAQQELADTEIILETARGKLAEVEQGLAILDVKLKETLANKDMLEANTKQCEDRLVRADKLIGGLADEKVRWADTVGRLQNELDHIAGDVLMSAGTVAYLGPFTGEFRADLIKEWTEFLDKYKVPHTETGGLVVSFGDPVKVRNWQIFGLPRDGLSTENAVITQFSKRWPLFIDPQGQANKWVRTMEKNNQVEVLKLTDKDFLRSLENAVRFGKPVMLENVLEELDPALEPILLKQTFKQQGTIVIKLGDAVIPYHDDFKLYLTSKLPNPHYTPEISTKVTILNFTLAPSGLEDQLLGRAVSQERPDLEEAKNQLIVQNAKMKQELKEIEDEILQRLSDSKGNPVDDIDLISALEASGIKSTEIKSKVAAAEVTEREIDITRMKYVPVAIRSQILFFCVSDLSGVDPMYQYSLDWYVNIFVNAISNAERADTIEKRIENINEYMTFSLYCNVCRSLFERHKLMFAFLLCSRIQLNNAEISPVEYRYLCAGSATIPESSGFPRPSWLPERSWIEFKQLECALPRFTGFVAKFVAQEARWKAIYDSTDPHEEELPGQDWDGMGKLLALRILRTDKLTNAVQGYVRVGLGQRFIEPQSTNLAEVFEESSPITPLIYVLSAGTDPASDLYKFAETRKFSKKLNACSLGQGQGPHAEALMRSAIERGQWVFFQNCHLAPSWMPSLERLIENIQPDFVHRDFRLWLTSMPSAKFPVSILQNGSKMTMEPPRGIKANLLKAYGTLDDDFLGACSKPNTFKSLLFSLCLFHGVILERRKFGSLGFNIPYEYTDGDLRICMSQCRMFLDEYETETPYKVLTYTAGHINYGGRVTDDWDRRCMMSILSEFYKPAVLESGYMYDPSEIYYQLDPEVSDHGMYIGYMRSLPINDKPDVFGLHSNANISFANNEAFALLGTLLALQPRSGGGGDSREDVVEELAKDIISSLPKLFDLEGIMGQYPVVYDESMNTVLQQEAFRFNRLLRTMDTSLKQILKAIKGLVVMSDALETMFNSLFDNQVPGNWSKQAYPSLKPLGSWVKDLIERCGFITGWVDNGTPAVFWISGFFFPQAFITGTLQNYARKVQISIHTIGFDFKVLPGALNYWEEITKPPKDGCYIRGMYMEAAVWDTTTQLLGESREKELYTDMAAMHLIPVANRKKPTSGIYTCPIYKTLTRAGTLSTTGHSTNFVMPVELPTDLDQNHWVRRATALITSLDF